MLTIHTMKVEGLNSPVGIDEDQPVFSWQYLSYRRGVVQLAARLLIASDPTRLEIGTADVWDSGQLTGNLPHLGYTGPKLADASRYWWSVIVQDDSGTWTASPAESFFTGLSTAAWQADWIWKPGPILHGDYAYFRQELTLKGQLRHALLFASANHYMKLFIDGVQISGYGTPAPTNPDDRKLYVAYDVTSRLGSSRSCLSAITHYLGGGGQNYVDAMPGFRLQLHLQYEDGTTEVVGTSTDWQTLLHIPHRSGTPFQQMRRISVIEEYDARDDNPAWTALGFDPSQCIAAVVADSSTRQWPMKRQLIEEGAVTEGIVPRIVQQIASGDEQSGDLQLRQVFDAGRILSGWPHLSLPGISGVTIRLRYSEDLDEAGFVLHKVSNEDSSHYYDQYTMRGDELESWQPNLSYKAFRYVEITGYLKPIVPGEQLMLELAHTGFEHGGTFHCSNELLNNLYDACIRTQNNNVLGQITDCPHREQAQYLADSDLQAETLLYNFDAHAAVDKVLTDFAGGQLANGTFPFVYPTNYEDPAFHLQIPEWDLHFCSLLWKLYLHTGELHILRRHYPTAVPMVDYYLGIRDTTTGLVPQDKGWHISDWPYPTVDHNDAPLAVQHMKLYLAVQILADSADLLGEAADAARYQQIMESLAATIHTEFYDQEAKRYRSAVGSDQMHQGVNALAVHLGLAPAADIPDIIGFAADSEWESRTVLSLPLLRALFDNGQAETAYRLLSKETYPGWGYMIRQGARTMWEGWDDIESHSHAWNGYPVRLLQEYIVGIQSLQPGWTEARIAPYCPQGLTSATAGVMTPLGQLSASWQVQDHGSMQLFTLSVQIPAGMSVRVELPVPEVAENAVVTLLESDSPVWSSSVTNVVHKPNGIMNKMLTDDRLTVQLGSGSYEFRLQIHESEADMS